MSTEVTGTVARRQLGRRLRRLRESADLGAADVARALAVGRQTVWRIETGQVATKPAMVIAMCHLYRADDAITESLAALSATTAEPGWWEDEYGAAVPAWFRHLVDLEAEACRVMAWDCTLIPGILQTADYARVVIRAAARTAGGDVERQVGLRLARGQRLLGRAPEVQVAVTLGEAALRCRVGGPEVMTAQVEHLRQLGAEGLADIRVLPFAAGAHPAMVGPFMILGVDGDADVTYLEDEVGGRYVEQEEHVDLYRGIFDAVSKNSTPIGDFQ